MEHILELKTEINKLSDKELMNRFNAKPVPEGKLNFYPVFALRMNKFKDFMFSELISEKNVKIKYRTFKTSWFIAIAVLDYCKDPKLINETVTYIKEKWDKEDFESFILYARQEKRFQKFL